MCVCIGVAFLFVFRCAIGAVVLFQGVRYYRGRGRHGGVSISLACQVLFTKFNDGEVGVSVQKKNCGLGVYESFVTIVCNEVFGILLRFKRNNMQMFCCRSQFYKF